MVMKIITRIALTALTLLIVASYVPGIEVAGIGTALVAAIVIGILNALVRPIVIILTLPVTIVTLGIFILVINAGMFMLAAAFVSGFSVATYLAGFIGSVCVSLVSTLTSRYL